MKAEHDDLRARSLLAVFAHPDDESLACGGLLAWCAHLGARVSVCCATAGELGQTAGMGSSSECGPADVRRARLQELRNAARILGVASLVFLDYEDGMLPWADPERLEADIRTTIARLRPDVVITFGEDGLYGHPDHIAIYERTTAAVAGLGEDAPALYYVTMPSGGMRKVVRHVAATRVAQGIRGEAPHKILGIADADAFGALAAPPTLVVEVGRFAARKLAAIKCHQTQLEDDALALVAARDAAHLLGTEQFHRADVGSSRDTFIERFASNLRSRVHRSQSSIRS
jgi:LmbE family N-acetylglucosaminyl deacetylase